MLFKQPLWARLADGSVTVAFRRWRRPTVRVGGTLKIPTGVLAIDALTIVDPDEITERDARRAGSEPRAELTTRLQRLDARSAHGPWTTEYLQLIEAKPEVRAYLAHLQANVETGP